VSNLIELISTAARRALFEYREQVYNPSLLILVYFLLAPALNLVLRAKNLSQRRKNIYHSNSELLVHHSITPFLPPFAYYALPPLSFPPLVSHCHPLSASLCLSPRTQVLTNSDKTQTDDGARHNLTIETISFVRILCAARAPLETALRVGVWFSLFAFCLFTFFFCFCFSRCFRVYLSA
jgi:hypothetical protein